MFITAIAIMRAGVWLCYNERKNLFQICENPEKSQNVLGGGDT